MRVPVALAFCVLALASCGGSGGRASVTRSELPKLVLQPRDVGKAWAQFDEGRQASADAHPGPRADAHRFDRIDGWKARYRRVAGRPGALAIVESRADLFRNPGGAKKDVDAYRRELQEGVAGSGATPRLLEAPDLGDAAVAGALRQGPLLFLTVAWRRANATASVTVQGRTGRTTLREVASLARRQDLHLRSAARG